MWAFKRSRVSTDYKPSLSLDGFRVQLRVPSEKDWQQWRDVRSANKNALEDFEPTWPEDCLSEDFFHRRLARQNYDMQRDRGYYFLIYNNTDNRLIGGVNINNVSRGAGQFGSLGYWLDQDHQGQGLMSESLSLVINYGFDQLKLHRFNAACLPDNHKSCNVLLKLGFKEEGYAEKYLRIAGKWQDHRLFGLNIDDWLKRKTA